MEQVNLRPSAVSAESEVSRDEKRLIASDLPPPVDDAVEKPESFGLNHLINKINYLNFFDRSLYVTFRHNQYQRVLSLRAKPNPCQDRQLTCHWQSSADSVALQSGAFCFENILIPDGKRFLLAKPELLEIDGRFIRLLLPDVCSAEDARRTRRHPCEDIRVYATQNGALFYGTMIDFCAYSFRIRVQTTPPQTFDWINGDQPVHLIVFDGNRTLFSGECQIIKQTHGHTSQAWVMSPVNDNIRRFHPREFRSARHQMVPLPSIRFVHPLTRRQVHLEVIDLSGSGLAIREESKYAVLLPGLMIPNLQICFGNGDHVSCVAQVIYTQPDTPGDPPMALRCGVAILDMNPDEHVKLLSLIQQAGDKNAYICNQVNLEDLWNFFFETGFIYPTKYEYIEKHKSKIKSVYKKLYTESPAIARHFIYQRNGQILAHMAMVRFYQNTWLIHHHAAIKSALKRGGLAVLNQIGNFINDSYRLNSIKMRYVLCYFRPENKFPNHVFGGAAKSILDPKRCSIDTFGYFHFRGRSRPHGSTLPNGWRFEPINNNDLQDLESWYADHSGGLMIRALDLEANHHDIHETEAAFQEIGLKRSRHMYSLKMAGMLKAVIIINTADLGLNMSDLTNSVKVIILKSDDLTYGIIQTCLTEALKQQQLDDTPVLVHPVEKAAALHIPVEKVYNLWIFDLIYVDDYFRYLKRLTKFFKR